jgi:hypothetical protein
MTKFIIDTYNQIDLSDHVILFAPDMAVEMAAIMITNLWTVYICCDDKCSENIRFNTYLFYFQFYFLLNKISFKIVKNLSAFIVLYFAGTVS